MTMTPAADCRFDWCVTHDVDDEGTLPLLHLGVAADGGPYLCREDEPAAPTQVAVLDEALSPLAALELARSLIVCGTQALADDASGYSPCSNFQFDDETEDLLAELRSA